jgi:hypothetical protein
MKTSLKTAIALTATVSFIAGCATKSENITAKYVSPMQYNSLNCQQVESEMIRVSNQVRTVAGVQDEEAQGDAIAMGVGMVLFWPALFFLAGDDKEQELAQLKGEHQALQQSAIQKECGFADQFEDADA